MVENHAFTASVAPDADRPGRYRWSVHEDGKARDRSVYSFATKREAQADADRFVAKLNVTWHIDG
jgi:hypothetical protein